MEYLKKLILWICLGAGVSVACLAWPSFDGKDTWTASIEHGELVLVAVTLLASAIGYAAMASVSGKTDFIKHLVIGLGLIALILAIGAYAGFRYPQHRVVTDLRQIAIKSYILLASSIVIGSLSIYVTHRSE